MVIINCYYYNPYVLIYLEKIYLKNMQYCDQNDCRKVKEHNVWAALEWCWFHGTISTEIAHYFCLKNISKFISFLYHCINRNITEVQPLRQWISISSYKTLLATAFIYKLWVKGGIYTENGLSGYHIKIRM